MHSVALRDPATDRRLRLRPPKIAIRNRGSKVHSCAHDSNERSTLTEIRLPSPSRRKQEFCCHVCHTLVRLETKVGEIALKSPFLKWKKRQELPRFCCLFEFGATESRPPAKLAKARTFHENDRTVAGRISKTKFLFAGSQIKITDLVIWRGAIPHPSLRIREEFSQGVFRMRLVSLALIPLSLVPTITGESGLVYSVGALVLGSIFFHRCARFAFRRSNATARRLLAASVVYLPLVFILMMLDKK